MTNIVQVHRAVPMIQQGREQIKSSRVWGSARLDSISAGFNSSRENWTRLDIVGGPVPSADPSRRCRTSTPSLVKANHTQTMLMQQASLCCFSGLAHPASTYVVYLVLGHLRSVIGQVSNRDRENLLSNRECWCGGRGLAGCAAGLCRLAEDEILSNRVEFPENRNSIRETLNLTRFVLGPVMTHLPLSLLRKLASCLNSIGAADGAGQLSTAAVVLTKTYQTWLWSFEAHQEKSENAISSSLFSRVQMR